MQCSTIPVFALRFFLLCVFFSCIITCCCFCPCLLLILFRLLSCVFASFCSALFTFWLLIVNAPVMTRLFALFPLCLRCFLLVRWSSFHFAFSRCLPPVANIIARAPLDTSMPFSRAPPMRYGPTTPIPTIRVHICTSGLVCVPVARVHVCVWRSMYVCC